MNHKFKNYPIFAFGGALLLIIVGSGILWAIVWIIVCTLMYCIGYGIIEKNTNKEFERVTKELEQKVKEYNILKQNIKTNVEKEKGGFCFLWESDYKEYPEICKYQKEINELAHQRACLEKILKDK